MSLPLQLETEEGYVSFHPVGKVSLAQCANLVCEAVRLACNQGADRVLVNICGLAGFQSPTTLPRFYFSEQLAAAATCPLKFAIVCDPVFIREDKFGVLVARNRGLLCESFTSEYEAIQWLLTD